MDLLAQVDRYCERTGPELWSEPFNAVSNLAFLVAGFFILASAKKDRGLRTYGWLVVLVGIGSATFHTVATIWAMAADVIPIGICLVFYLWAYLRLAARCTPKQTWACLIAFGVVSGALAACKAPAWVNETHQYFGAFLALVLLAWKRPEARAPFAGAAVLFGLSMLCRTLDPLVCDTWPLGTHFLWHTLNGVALYLAGRAYAVSALGFSVLPRPDLR